MSRVRVPSIPPHINSDMATDARETKKQENGSKLAFQYVIEFNKSPLPSVVIVVISINSFAADRNSSS